ncbi:MAG: type IV pilus assembly protein FimV, partial [Janthinobacterium lividum]
MHRVRLRSFRQFGVVVLFVSGANCHAIGLGAITLQSALGQPLVARVPLLGDGRLTTAANCVRARIESIDGALLAPVQIALTHNDSVSLINLTTVQKIDEPAVSVSLELSCAQAVKRSFQLLLDPLIINGGVAPVVPPVVPQPLRIPLKNGMAVPTAAMPARAARAQADGGAELTPEQLRSAKAAREARAEKSRENRERRAAAATHKTTPKSPSPASAALPATAMAASGNAAQDKTGQSAAGKVTPAPLATPAPSAGRATLRLTTSDVLSDAAPKRSAATGKGASASAAPAAPDALDTIGADAMSAESRMSAMAQENEAKMRGMLTEVQTLRQATERVRQQAMADKQALEVERANAANSLPQTWVYLLGGLLLLALAALGALLWRRRSEQSIYRSSWDDIIAETEATPVKVPREPSNVAPDVDIAVPFFDIPVAEPSVRVEETVRPAIKPVERFEEPEEFEVPPMTAQQISEAEEIERLVQRVYQVPAAPAVEEAPAVPSYPTTVSAAPVAEMEPMNFQFDDPPAELPALSFYDVDLSNGEPAQIDPDEFEPKPLAAEVSAAVQEAETWMSEHNPRKAMEIF